MTNLIFAFLAFTASAQTVEQSPMYGSSVKTEREGTIWIYGRQERSKFI